MHIYPMKNDVKVTGPHSLINRPTQQILPDSSMNNEQVSGPHSLINQPTQQILPDSSMNNEQVSGQPSQPNLPESENNAQVSKLPRLFRQSILSTLSARQASLANLNSPFCRLDTSYERICKIGQGTFGEVFKARDLNDPEKLVAMKKILTENETEGFPITALREINILKKLKHDNIVKLIEICRSQPCKKNNFKSTFFLVFEFCQHDLAGILSNKDVKFSLAEIKMMLKQIFQGLYFIHSNNIMHRDMKAANILVTKNGTLKLADFGLSRPFSRRTEIIKKEQNIKKQYTSLVVTLWFRSPELLLGEKDYGPPIDLWATGCIMAEFWTRCPILQGNSEQEQISLICKLCGSMTPEVWPGVDKYKLYKSLELPKDQKRKVKERLMPYIKDRHGCDLLDKLLTLDPSKRIDADKALNHDFFWTDPMPCDLSKLMSQHTQSMFEYLRRFQHRPSQNIAKKPRLMEDRIF